MGVLSPRMLRRLLQGILLGTVTGLAVIFKATIRMLFKRDQITRMASVELWVVLTTLLLVLRFLLDFFGPWYANRSMTNIVLTIEMLNYSMVHYTLGQMQLSAERVNDYFQVWAVLLVTLQYSVKIGRPYSRSKQIPLLDLMSSFWTANIIRMQTFPHLQIPLWLIWAVNAARIISYFFSSDKAEGINQESIRIVADYMNYEHNLDADDNQVPNVPDPETEFNMKRCKYVVLGEHQVLKDEQEDRDRSRPHTQRRRFLRLDPKNQEKLITVDKIWDVDSSRIRLPAGTASQTTEPNDIPQTSIGYPSYATCHADELKDMCLSFSLYKLLRQQFYDHDARLPEQQKKKIGRLVFKYILHDTERAFRIVATELSFLQDLFYSKHAAMFAAGFPATNLVLSLLLVMATWYIAYPVHYIPERMDQADHNKITHGVFITRVIIALIIGKELAEICIYVFSQWTVVLMLCSYAKHGCLRHVPVEMATWMMLRLMTWRGRWNERIRQHNLLIATHRMKLCGFTWEFKKKLPRQIKIEASTKVAIIQSFKMLEKDPKRLGSYFSNAFGAPGKPVHDRLLWAVDKLEADTHRILVWHIATCLCEINLATPEKAMALKRSKMQLMPFVEKPEHSTGDEPDVQRWKHYITAASLSNYCAYLVTQALVPDNGVVALKVFDEVYKEIKHVTMDSGFESMQHVFDCLKEKFRKLEEAENRGRGLGQGEPDEEAPEMPEPQDQEESQQEEAPEMPEPQDQEESQEEDDTDFLQLSKSLTRKGVELGNQLMDEFRDDTLGLWEKLAVFWTEFLLHLSASTRATKHKTRLAGSQELTTHLWALLCHAGFAGDARGPELLDPVFLEDINPQS
ncbi:hypothetical protein ACP4OV_002413 [Aristida adscensionis]